MTRSVRARAALGHLRARITWLLPRSLAGHTSLISQVRFKPTGARYLLTAGYDNTCRLWSGRQFKLTKTLAGHEGKVMSADVSPTSEFLVATGGYDRTIKLYAPDTLLLDTVAEA